MNDYKMAIMEKAEELAFEELGIDFHNLPAGDQDRIYEMAIDRLHDDLRGMGEQ